MTRPIIHSYGGGTQTIAILVLVAQGKLPTPRLAIMADTGRERTSTWRYLEQYALPLMQQLGIEFHRAGHDLATVDLYAGTGGLLLPAFTATGKLPTFCSNEWKRRVVRRYLRSLGYGPDKPIAEWLGMSLDEIHRLRQSDVDWIDTRWPLVFDVPLRRVECETIIARYGLPLPSKSACWMCLAGETEIVTRDGIRQIKDVVDTSPDLLVPLLGTKGGLGETGKFISAPVRSFGIRRLWEITLRRGRSERVVYATAEHRWFLAPGEQWQSIDELSTTTAHLKPGDRLKNLRAMPLAKENPLPFAIAQGFVFGDGTRGEGDRPASLDIFEGKAEALLPFFLLCNPRRRTNHSGNETWFVYGLPRTWKELPDIRESRAFLLGWLSGWFAADGTVNKKGYGMLYAAKQEHLEFARSVCSALGVRTVPVRGRMRKGIKGKWSMLHTLNIYVRDLPIEFFLLKHHRERVESISEQQREDRWVVHRVQATERMEEVFCATVEGAGAFALADGLMTGNCPHLTNDEWRDVRDNDPGDFERAVALDADIRAADERGGVYLHPSRVPLADADLGAEAAPLPLLECANSCWT